MRQEAASRMDSESRTFLKIFVNLKTFSEFSHRWSKLSLKNVHVTRLEKLSVPSSASFACFGARHVHCSLQTSIERSVRLCGPGTSLIMHIIYAVKRMRLVCFNTVV